MADVVQYRLERMVDELDDLERRGLFTRREISEIVKKRRHFEYRLKRPCSLKEDYLSYIDYESHLDSLRKLRKKSLLLDTTQNDNIENDSNKKKNKKKWKKSISDFACTRRILDIYRLACVRYKGDIDLWFRYLEFCRERGHGKMKQVLAQVLRFHPKVPGLWIYAAAWEFDHNLNVAAARALMQSGLRACPDSEDLWVEYLRMELTYLNKLKARKAVLGEDGGAMVQHSGDEEDEEWKDKNKDLFMSLNEEGHKKDGLDAKEGNAEKKEDAFQEQALIIFRTIYSEAIEAIPTGLNMRKRFLAVLDELDLAYLKELKDEIMSNIKKDFLKDENYWDWFARLKILHDKKGKHSITNVSLSQFNEAVVVYEEALNILPSAKMFSLYARFCLDVIVPEQGDVQNSGSGNKPADGTLTSHLLKVYEKTESRGCMTEDLAHQYISFYLQLGEVDEARKLAVKLCDGKLAGAAKLWVLRASLEMKYAISKSASMNKDDQRSLFEILRCALSKVAILEAGSLWLMAFKFFSHNKEYFDKLVQNFLILLTRSGGTEGNISISFAIVNWILQKDGIQQAREMYRRLFALPHPSLSTYRSCIELESNLAVVGDGDALANARKLYESALSIYKQNVGLWQDYYSFEKKVGTSDTANAIYWRARKTVGDKLQ